LGGSQYDPQDEGDNEDELEYQEVIPEGEDDGNASEAKKFACHPCKLFEYLPP